MKKILFFIFFIALTGNIFCQHRKEIHCKHFVYGYPYGTPETNDLIIRDIYALSSNDSTKFADWVAYLLTKGTILGKNHTRDWAKDPWLEDEETLEPEDYIGANKSLKVDRGHQAPLANFSKTPDYFETNYLSNITPQSSELNQGPWKDLEDFERNLLKLFDTIYVMTGPLYQRYFGYLPNADESHRIPSGYWKIIVIKSNNTFETFAFKMDQNTPRNYDFTKSLTTIEKIEQLTGLDFLWELDDKIEKKIETKDNTKLFKNYLKQIEKLKY